LPGGRLAGQFTGNCGNKTLDAPIQDLYLRPPNINNLEVDEMPAPPSPDHRPLRIALLSYRSHPHCGGQGVYVRNLSHALGRLGHRVTVVSGPPYPELVNGARLHRLPSLDLYNPEALFRTPSFRELCDPVNFMEWTSVATMGFPEPFTFGLRAARHVRSRIHEFDIVHDNQSLSYGVRSLACRIPTVATIHHPITVDRRLAVRAASSVWQKAQQLRWYSFIGMQKRVAPSLNRIITVSRCARNDIAREFKLSPSRFAVVPNGIDTDCFHPLPGVAREPFRLIATASADVPLKGLAHLLRAVALLAPAYPRLQLIVVGRPKEKSPVKSLIGQLGIESRIRFMGAIDQTEYLRQYARAWAAVVPSLYEGFGLPAGEAMACGVPVISTTGGALPEVVGDAGVLVPPADPQALAQAIETVCTRPDLAASLGRSGYDRVMAQFTWEAAARKTTAVYRQAIHDYH
jgi:MMP alpha-(1->4)-mannosyltransferase